MRHLILLLGLLIIPISAEFLNPGIQDSPPTSVTPPQLGPDVPPILGPDVPPSPSPPDATPSPKPKSERRYHVWAVEFARVETPFMIGLWIFCSSIAKIGEEYVSHKTRHNNQVLCKIRIYYGSFSGHKTIGRTTDVDKEGKLAWTLVFITTILGLLNAIEKYILEYSANTDKKTLANGFHMAPRLNQIFPESCLLITVGVLIGMFLFMTSSVRVSPLTPDTFFLYLMPPIILDAGYFMPNRLFFDHLGTILMFAVIGTIFNTLTIGGCLWACGLTGLYGTEAPLLDMLLFGALISAVDPVAVLAVFEEIHVNEILYIVVFGESLLNDAVTVVLYHMFEAYVEMGPTNIQTTDILAGFCSFFVVGVGGTIIGVIWGFGTGLMTRYTERVRVIEPIFIFVMAYLAYLNAEIFHMSGIMAVTFCGITMKNYVEANISHKSHTTVKYAMKMLSSSSETIIFMFLGVATVSNSHDWNTWFVILTIFFCSFFRAMGVIILTAVVNKFRLYKLNKVDKFVMSYGGLRGAVAFALVLLIDPRIVRLQPMFVTTTIAVIYFTVFFQGITIKPLVKILNVKRAEKRKPTMNERIHEKIMDHAMAGIEDILGHHGNHYLRDKFKRFDNKFIRPYLLREFHGAEPKILETYSKLAMRDAIDYMRRNASTIGNISGTESMSAIFRNYTAGNLNGSVRTKRSLNHSYSQLDSSTWNIDLQELEYNPSKKDLTDAKIHHLLAEELVQPYRRHRRLSYSRHAVHDRDLSTQVNYRMHMNIRRLVGDQRKHHHKRSKRLKDGKQHVSFPGIQQNGSAKQFTHDYLEEVIQETENEDDKRKRNGKDDWDRGITFTANPSPEEEEEDGVPSLLSQLISLPGLKRGRLVKQYRPRSGDYQDVPTVAETSLPWRRDAMHAKMKKLRERPSGSWWCWTSNEGGLNGSPVKKLSRDSTAASDDTRVTTPTALETSLPWKRNDEGEISTGPLKQSEFPPWCSNKEYLAYNSPSATFLGTLEESRRGSLMGLFRGTPPDSPQASVLLIEEGTSLLGAEKKARRGSMLELSHQDDEYLIVGNTGSTPSLSEQWSSSQRTTQRQSSLPVNTSVESFTSSASLDGSPRT